MKIKIKRTYRANATPGKAWIENDIGLPVFDFKTLELPWKYNMNRVSCIPRDTYTWVKYQSPKHGTVLLLKDVPNRSMIEMHTGNYTSQILGCILPGSNHADINADGIMDVTNSRNTMKKILSLLGDTGTIEIS